jgi:hypothetical protein
LVLLTVFSACARRAEAARRELEDDRQRFHSERDELRRQLERWEEQQRARQSEWSRTEAQLRQENGDLAIRVRMLQHQAKDNKAAAELAEMVAQRPCPPSPPSSFAVNFMRRVRSRSL